MTPKILTTQERQGEICQYCQSKPYFVRMKYGGMMKCPSCGASVGVNELFIPVGCLANDSLKYFRKEFHKASNYLIELKSKKDNVSEAKAKELLYDYLRGLLNLDFTLTSIALLDENEIQIAITAINNIKYGRK